MPLKPTSDLPRPSFETQVVDNKMTRYITQWVSLLVKTGFLFSAHNRSSAYIVQQLSNLIHYFWLYKAKDPQKCEWNHYIWPKTPLKRRQVGRFIGGKPKRMIPGKTRRLVKPNPHSAPVGIEPGSQRWKARGKNHFPNPTDEHNNIHLLPLIIGHSSFSPCKM